MELSFRLIKTVPGNREQLDEAKKWLVEANVAERNLKLRDETKRNQHNAVALPARLIIRYN